MRNLVGQMVDGYQIQDVIGRGGMGIVYKALDVGIDKIVVLKMIDPQLVQDNDFLERFKNEPKLQAKLTSPYIVQVFTSRQTEQGLFIAMEFVDGGTLADVTRQRGRMEWQEALPIFKKMLMAIEHAHQAGIIHRDIKPQNVLIAKTGEVKVTDFGLAKFQQATNATRTHTVAGTLNYMPPEQVEGLKNVDQRSDVYSLAMTFYEVLAGRVPWEKGATEYRVLKSIVEEELPPPTDFNAEIPPSLSNIIMRGLEKEPASRYQTPQDMLDDIERFEQGETIGFRESATIVTKTSPGQTDATIVSPSSGFKTVPQQQAAPVAAPQVEEQSYSAYTPPADSQIQGQSKSRMPLIIGIMLMLIIGAASGYYYFSGDSGATQVLIDSNIEGANVWINGQLVGTTPHSQQLELSQIDELKISAEGFAEWRREALQLEAGASNRFNAELSALTAVTGLSVSSTPPGATVFIDGAQVGITPWMSEELNIGSHKVRVQLNGYKVWEESHQVVDGQTSNIVANLVQERPPSVINGTLVMQSYPPSSVYVNDRIVSGAGSSNTSTEVPEGPHKVTFKHPQYGSKSFNVVVSGNKRNTVTCYFESLLTIQSSDEGGDLWSYLVIDGELRLDLATPQAKLPLGPGEHTITVQRSGYEVIGVVNNGTAMTESSIKIDVEAGARQKEYHLVFSLKEH